ncbi:MAG: carboxypeptidase regulatory-like domain-containing protein [Acidobacteriaceae bacterium]
MKTGGKQYSPFVRRVLCLLLISVCACSVVLAQAGRGRISGLVTDSAGAMVPGAKVTAKNRATGTTLSTITTAAGLYSFVSVAPGSYDVTVSQKGFDTTVESNIVVSVDQVSAINVKMNVGAVNTVVTVDAAASLLDTSNSTVGQLISAEAIDRVPLVTRDVYQLVQLSAGVLPTNGTPNASDTPGIFNQRSLADVSAYTINGSLQGTVMYMLDGSPIGIAENNAASIIPAFQVPEDGVDEFRMETQNTPATYASGGGGVISLVSKSGSNRFHGDGFVYIRPSALAANDYFYKQNNPGLGTPDFHRYQEGGAISGPIFRDKLFFFGDYEDTQQQQLETGTFTVPTPAERTGNFSGDTGFTVYNPLVPDQPAQPDGTIPRQPFAGNVIPKGDLNPIALLFASKYPLPNNAGEGPYHVNNLTASGLDPNNAHKFDVRLDYTPSDKQRIFGRFSWDNLFFSNANLYGSEYYPLYYQNVTHGRNILLADDYTLSPTSVLQLRYSFTRHFENQTGDPQQNGFNITSVGFPQALEDEVLYHQIPAMTFGTTAPVGGTTNYDTFIYASENSDVSATYTKTFGKHAIDLGFEYQKKFMNVGQPPAPAGTYSFDDSATSSTTFAGDGSDFASFLLGMGSAPGGESGNFTKDVFAAEANPYYAAFIQDNYHLTPTFTVNAGVRWEIFGGRTERFNRLEYFDPTAQYTVNGVGLRGGERFVGSGQRSPFTTNLKDFGPRLSFAWQTQPNFVVRGGGGIYYGPSAQMVANPSLDADGFSSVTNWNATTYNADGNTVMVNSLSNPFPNGVVQPLGNTAGPATGVGSILSTVLHSQRITTTYNFNLGIEYQFAHDSVFSLGYVGSRGLFLPFGAVDLNTLSLQTIQQYGAGLCVTGDTSCMVPNTQEAALPPTSAFYGSPTVPKWVQLEPFPQYNDGGINDGVAVNGYPAGDSEYSSLQAKVEKRMSQHFTTLANFTWGKLMTDDGAPPLGFIGYHGVGAPQDIRNLNLEHAISSQDVKIQFNWQASYDLPIGRGRALDLERVGNAFLGGWTVNTIAYISTGVPVNAPTGTGSPYFNQRVNETCDPASHAHHTAAQWFDFSCFSQPTSPFTAGTAPAFLSSVRTNGAHDLDVSLYKVFPFGAERNLRFEFSSYNVTNSEQFGYPNIFWNPQAETNPSVMAGFGQVTSSANLPRQFQFGSRFTF